MRSVVTSARTPLRVSALYDRLAVGLHDEAGFFAGSDSLKRAVWTLCDCTNRVHAVESHLVTGH